MFALLLTIVACVAGVTLLGLVLGAVREGGTPAEIADWLCDMLGSPRGIALWFPILVFLAVAALINYTTP